MLHLISFKLTIMIFGISVEFSIEEFTLIFLNFDEKWSPRTNQKADPTNTCVSAVSHYSSRRIKTAPKREIFVK